jgi:hypothetical protein
MTEQAKTESTSLVVIQPTDVRAFFVESKNIDSILTEIETLANDFTPDVTTLKGRKLIGSQAYAVARTKTFIDGLGKELVDAEKEIPKRIDATRKRVRDFCDELQARVRKPLTDYENAEKSRVAALDQRIAAIQELGAKATAESPSAEIQLWVSELAAIAIDGTWDEYQDRAQVAKEAAKVKLEAFLQTRLQWEAQQAEIARLKEEREEQERLAREARIKEEAKLEAERESMRKQLELERQKREAEEAQAKAEQDARDAKLKAEQDAKDAQQRLEQQRIDAEEQARIAAAQAEERERLAVIQAQEAERQRQIDEQNRIAQEEEQRKAEVAAKAANIEHQKLINNEILDDMQAAAAAKGFQLSREMAVAILSGVVFGKVRHTQVQY